MNFEWDPAKAESNSAKHGISFPVAAECFLSEGLELEDDREDYGEVRVNRYARLKDSTPVVVTFVERDGVKRLISARKANRKERNLIP